VGLIEIHLVCFDGCQLKTIFHSCIKNDIDRTAVISTCGIRNPAIPVYLTYSKSHHQTSILDNNMSHERHPKNHVQMYVKLHPSNSRSTSFIICSIIVRYFWLHLSAICYRTSTYKPRSAFHQHGTDSLGGENSLFRKQS